MEFRIQHCKGRSRVGQVKIGEQLLETPCCLVYTRAGTVPHIVQELLENIQNLPSSVQLTLPSLVDQPSDEVLKKHGKGIMTFLGLQDFGSVLTVQDPSQSPPSGYNEDKSVSVWNPGGRRKISAAQFSSKLSVLRPNAAECLCDTIPATGQTAKRIRKSVDRTLKFLDEIIEYKAKHEELSSCELLGAIEGSDSLEERLRSARETASRPVAGFTLEGFGSSTADWESLLQQTIDVLPKDRVRLIQGIGSRDDVIRAVECGIDIFDSSFPYQVAERGCAIVSHSHKRMKPQLNYNNPTSAEDSSGNLATKLQTNGLLENRGNLDEGNREFKDANTDECLEKEPGKSRITDYEIDLNETSYNADMSPVETGCTCYCCTNHTRAYIHHLLVTKEMLARVLLMIHNLHQYFLFFKEMRQAMNGDTWEEFKERYLTTGH